MTSDATVYILAAAALAASVHFYQQNQQLITQSNACQAEYRGFREGIVYGK
ncbi:hypothetical protein [Brunnivagina elsteri]|uniref:hypothetical protein n=1 Tax=Brunnivagina elsteri TaxID=1247191 RepID=UPI0013045385|nr:hypothetical protein [Calothrix elsteri]